MTPNDIIVDVKRLAQDTGVLRTPDAYADATLLAFVNQVLKQTALLRPDLFSYITDITTTPDTVTQNLPADSTRLVELYAVKDGTTLLEVSRETLDQTYPQWRTDPSGVPVNYMRNVRNPNGYFLYPRPSAGVTLVGEYVQTPPTYTLNATILRLPDSFLPAISAGVVGMIESINNTGGNMTRAKEFETKYVQALGLSLQTRVVTDTEAGGLNLKQVI